MFFVNPEIVEESDEQIVYSEGCLSVPEMFADVERPAAIRARWLNYDGVAHHQQLDGFLVTCLPHEMDHPHGVLVIIHLSKLTLAILLQHTRHSVAIGKSLSIRIDTGDSIK